MRPQFTILSLLAFTALAALFTVVITNPGTIWRHLWLLSWLLFVANLVALAFNSSSREAALFARTALACGVIYLALPHVFDFADVHKMPHKLAADWMVGEQKINSTYWFLIYSVMHPTFCLVFGLLGGSLAVWHNRRHERREHRPSP